MVFDKPATRFPIESDRETLRNAGISLDDEFGLVQAVEREGPQSTVRMAALEELLHNPRFKSARTLQLFKELCASRRDSDRGFGCNGLYRILGRHGLPYYRKLMRSPLRRSDEWAFSRLFGEHGTRADAAIALGMLKRKYTRKPKQLIDGWVNHGTSLLLYLDRHRHSPAAREAFEWTRRHWNNFSPLARDAIARQIPPLGDLGPNNWVLVIGRTQLPYVRLESAVRVQPTACILRINVDHPQARTTARLVAESPCLRVTFDRSLLRHRNLLGLRFTDVAPPLVLKPPMPMEDRDLRRLNDTKEATNTRLLGNAITIAFGSSSTGMPRPSRRSGR